MNDLSPESDILAPPDGKANAVFFGPDGLRAGWSLLLYAIIVATLLTALTFLTRHVMPNQPRLPQGAPRPENAPSLLLGNEAALFAIVSFATWIMSRLERRPLAVYGLGGTRKLPHFLAGLAWGAAFLSLLVFALDRTGLLLFDRRLLFGPATYEFAAVWAVGFLFVGLFEEYLLRGYLQYTLSRGLSGAFRALNTPRSQTLGFWAAAFLLSFVFGLGHGSNPGESPIGLLSAGGIGLVFCLSLWRTGSLWWAIGFHAAWDWAQSFLYGVADSGTMVKFHLFATHPAGRPLLSGGTTGPEGSLYILPIMLLIAAVVLLTLRRPALLIPPALSLNGSPTDPGPAPTLASLHR